MRKITGMTRSFWVAVLMLVCPPAGANYESGYMSEPGLIRLGCPLCGEVFDAPTPGECHFGGPTEEGWPTFGDEEETQNCRVYACPKCQFLAFVAGFRTPKDNSDQAGPTSAPAMDTPHDPMTALESAAIRSLLKEQKDREVNKLSLSARLDLCERVYRDWPLAGRQLVNLYLLRAWLADYDYDVDVATTWRAKALAAIDPLLANGKSLGTFNRLWLGYLRAVLTGKLGKPKDAIAAFDELAGKIKDARREMFKQADQLDKKHEKLATTHPEDMNLPEARQMAAEAQRFRKMSEKLEWMIGEAAHQRALANQKVLGPEAGCGVALKGSALDRLAFLETFGDPAAKENRSIVVKMVADENEAVAKQAIEALGRCWPPTDEIISALTHALPAHTHEAAIALGDFGSAAKPAVSELVKLVSKHEVQYWRATETLGKLGPDAAEAVPALIKALPKPGECSDSGTIKALGRIGPAAKAAVPSLIEHLNREEWHEAAEALPKIDPHNMEALRLIMDHTRGYEAMFRTTVTYADACEALPRFGSAALPFLLKIAKDPQSRHRSIAIEAIGKMGPLARSAIPDLLVAAQLGEGTPEAVEALGNIGKPAISALTELLSAKNADVRHATIECLEKMGPAAHPAGSSLAKLLEDSDANTAIAAAHAIFAIDPVQAAQQSPAIAKLADRLAELNDPKRRIEAAYLRAAIHAKSGLEALIEALDRTPPPTLAIELIGRLGEAGKPAAAKLIGLTKTLSPTLSPTLPLSGLFGGAANPLPAAIAAIGQVHPDPEAAVPALVHWLGTWELAVPAAKGLAGLGPQAAPATMKLVQCFRRFRGNCESGAAIEALGYIGRPAKEALPALLGEARYVGDGLDEPTRRLTIAKAILRIDPGNGKALAMLAQMLRDTDPFVRRQTVRAVAELGPLAAALLPDLKDLKAAKDEFTVDLLEDAVSRVTLPASQANP